MNRNRFFTGSLGALLALGISTAGIAQTEQTQEPAERSNQQQRPSPSQEEDLRQQLHENLRDIEVALQEIEERASELEIYTMQPGSIMFWESHTYEISRIEERIEQIGQLIPQLQQNAAVEPWQKEIIDDISGLTKAMSAQAEKAIDFLEENYSRADFVADDDAGTDYDPSVYNARVASIYRFAEHMDDLVNRVQGEQGQQGQQGMSSERTSR